MENGSLLTDIGILIQDYSIALNQVWELEACGDYYRIINGKSEMYLDVINASTGSGACIIQQVEDLQDSVPRDNQLWSLEQAGDYYYIVNKNSGYYLDVDGRSTANDVNILQKEPEYPPEQLWMLLQDGDTSYYRIYNGHSGLYLDVLNNSTTMDFYVVQDELESSDSQLWRLVAEADAYRLVNKKSGYYLDVASAGTAAGAYIVQDEFEDQANQLWELDPDIDTPVTLVKYSEEFYLSGFSIKQNQGSNAGIFYSEVKEDTLGAYIDLQYQFLKSQNPLDSAPDLLSQDNVTVESTIQSFSHNDEAVLEINNVITPAAVANLPADEILPVMYAFEDISASYCMDEFWADPSQLWQIEKNGGVCRLINKNSGYYLDVAGAATSTGAAVVVNEYQDSDSQVWLLASIMGQENGYQLINRNSDLYLDVAGASLEAGAALVQSGFNESAGDVWKLEQYGNYYLIINSNSGLYMGVQDASTEAGAAVIQAEFRSTGTHFEIDLDNENEVTSRSLYLKWFDTASGDILDIDRTFQEFDSWEDWSDDDRTNLKMLTLSWYSGENRLVRIGLDSVDYADLTTEKEEVLGYIRTGASGVKHLIKSGLYVEKVYNWFLKSSFTAKQKNLLGLLSNKIMRAQGPAIKAALIEQQSVISGLKSASELKLSLSGNSSFKNKWLNYVDSSKKLAKTLQWVGHGLTVAMEAYTFYSVASKNGWSNTGIFAATMYVAMDTVYYVILNAMFNASTKWNIVGALVLVSDFVTSLIFGSGWSTMLMEKIMELLTEYEERSTLDIQVIDSWVDIDDTDGNGTDAGDIIYITTRVQERVELTGNGDSSDLDASFINSCYVVNEDDLTPYGVTVEIPETVVESTSGTDWTQNIRDIGIKLTLGEGTNNLPVNLRVESDFRFRYDKWTAGFHEIESYHEEEYLVDTLSFDFDVMPGSLDDFLFWEPVSCQDWDGDGLPDSSENQFYNAYQVTNRLSGKDLTVTGGQTDDGAPVIQDLYDAADNQKWILSPLSGNWYQLLAAHSQKCLEVADSSLVEGAAVIQNTSHIVPDNQLWTVQKSGSQCRLINKKSGLYLDVDDASTASGANIVQDEYEDSDNQVWLMGAMVGQADCYMFINKNSELYLDVYEGSTVDGARVIQARLNESNCQIWKLEPYGDYYLIVNQTSGYCLDVKNASTALDVQIIQSAGNYSPSQYWQFEPLADGCFKVVNACSGLCLDVADSSLLCGAGIVQNSYTGSDSQKWTLDVVAAATSWENWDSDADGLSDYYELANYLIFKTNPLTADTDGDGLSDGEEIAGNTSPVESDQDEDGLTDWQETRGWTVEINFGDLQFSRTAVSDPDNPDTDADGLTDGEEYALGTNPAGCNSDGDSLDDFYDLSPLTWEESPAPTDPVVDDFNNTFGWTAVAGCASVSDYEYSLDSGDNWTDCTANPQPVGDCDYAAGTVQVRVKLDTAAGRPLGAALLSDQAFHQSEQLLQPARPTLKDDLAAWTAVENENAGYLVKLYQDAVYTGQSGETDHGAALSFDFSASLVAAGNYTVAVTARGVGDYRDSPESAPSDSQYVAESGGTDGQACLPAGSSALELGDNGTLSLKNCVQTAGGDTIIVGGQSQALDNYTGGSLSEADLSDPLNIGDREILIQKAVQIQSGVDGEPVSITNPNSPGITLSIPDGAAVLAEDSWDGVLISPQPASGTGTGPSGFSIGDMVIEAGSTCGVILFDIPVTLELAGVTGPVGYKPACSDSWVQITLVASGDYADPEAPPFPAEAFISNGTDTKIITWHLTDFATLDELPDLSVDPSVLYESTLNDGSLSPALLDITLNDGEFEDNLTKTEVAASNLPEGLDYSVTRTDDTHLAVTITGNAAHHSDQDDIDNLTFTVSASVITGAVSDLSTPVISLDFNDPADLSVNPSILYESILNDGSLSPALLEITLNHGVFDDNLTKTEVADSNLPEGLDYSVTRTDDTHLAVTITGNAAHHSDQDDIDNLTFTVSASVITGTLSDLSTPDISLDFNDPANLSVNPSILYESTLNDGSLSPALLEITLNHGVFDDNLTKTEVAASNLPEGLDYSVTRTDDTHLAVTITGYAAHHSDQDDIDNLTFTVSAAVITGTVSDLSTPDVSLDFNDPAAPPPDPPEASSLHLLILQSGRGRVIVSPDQSTYAPGQTVQFTAVPDTGWTFKGWHGAVSGTDNPIELIMEDHCYVAAAFAYDSQEVPDVPAQSTWSIIGLIVLTGGLVVWMTRRRLSRRRELNK